MNRAIDQNAPAESRLDDGLRFAERMHRMRMLGTALGAVCVGGSLWVQNAHWLAWTAVALNAFAWPHIALALASRNANPYHAELRNLIFDSASGGAWIAAIGFSPAPSTVMFAMLAMGKAAIGGLPFLARCLAAQLAAAAVVLTALGFELHLQPSSGIERLASLPLLVVYPITIALMTYRLARRVRRQNQTLAELSSIDGLSGLLNHTHWESAVASEFQRCRRIGHPSSVVMMDIDHFKVINDRHGHPAGDAVIREVSGILRTTLRLHDVPGRYGGEEFGIVLPGTGVEGAEVLAERIRVRIESAVLDAASGARATASLGIATYDPRDASHADWIARADRALYRAKESGRNRTAQDATPPAPAQLRT